MTVLGMLPHSRPWLTHSRGVTRGREARARGEEASNMQHFDKSAKFWKSLQILDQNFQSHLRRDKEKSLFWPHSTSWPVSYLIESGAVWQNSKLLLRDTVFNEANFTVVDTVAKTDFIVVETVCPRKVFARGTGAPSFSWPGYLSCLMVNERRNIKSVLS